MANATTKLSVNATCRTFPNQLFFFFNDTATTEIYTLSLHDALPILSRRPLMGMVQALLRPGTLRASSMRRTSSSVEIDRKSTRLNSSHSQISYAVFCLKKKHERRSRTSHSQ